MSPSAAVVYDLDDLEAWCKTTDEVPDCQMLLGAWNLFGDMPGKGNSLFSAADRRANDVYDKLFFGNNLPSVTPPGEHYVPVWTAAEIAVLKHVLVLGLAEFRARVR